MLIISFQLVQVLRFGPTFTVVSVRRLSVRDLMKRDGVVVDIPSFAIIEMPRGRLLPIRRTAGAGRVAARVTVLESSPKGLLGEEALGELGSSYFKSRVLLIRVGSIIGGGKAGSKGMKLMDLLTARFDLKRPGLMTSTLR